MSMRSTLPVLATLLLVSCGHHGKGHEAVPHDPIGSDQATESRQPSAEAQVHALACGCALDDVGVCGEYIEVEGAYLALVAPHDLGSMPFCHKDGLRARVDGEVRDGKFVASTFAYEE